MICSFPRTANSKVFPELYHNGEIELELVPQGTLAERIRAGGAGIPAFYTPASVNTPLAEGKETRVFNGHTYVMEYGIRADFSLVKCKTADRYGNLLYNKTARNFGPIMCTAANTTIVQAKELLSWAKLTRMRDHTRDLCSKSCHVANPADESTLVAEERRYPW
jgi:3-oxoadipate CoA-transferase, alpha subunit